MQHAAEAIKNDNGRAAGDDIANALAVQKDTTARNFVSKYAQMAVEKGQAASQSEGIAQGQAAMGLLQQGYGARMGSEAMRTAAYLGGAGSTTRYSTGEKGWEERRADAHSLIEDGLITPSDATAAIKANQKRADGSGASFGKTMMYLSSNPDGYTSKDMLNMAMEGSGPGEAFGGHTNTVKSFAQPTYDNFIAAAGDPEKQTALLAEISGRYNVLTQVSREKANVWADGVMAKPSGHFTQDASGNDVEMNVQQYLTVMRRDPDFQLRSREYEQQASGAIAAFQAQQAAQQAAAQAALGGNAGGIPPLPGQGRP
jgi:hypothetical protein